MSPETKEWLEALEKLVLDQSVILQSWLFESKQDVWYNILQKSVKSYNDSLENI